MKVSRRPYRNWHAVDEQMKILPVMAKEIVWLHEDGTFEMAPLQVFRERDGGTAIRIGRNLLLFREDGTLAGTEAKAGDDVDVDAMVQAYERQGEGRGLPPEESYYHPSTPGYETETRAWAHAKKEGGGDMYAVVPAEKKKPQVH